MTSADVVIIGGGIVGSSIAYHLTAAGCRNIIVLERESSQGKGSAGKDQVGRIVQAMLGLAELPGVDATDALAIAITHLSASRSRMAIARSMAASPRPARR